VETIVYVDGFNLYYNALRGHPETKWLDLRALSCALLPAHTIVQVKYFTAYVIPTEDDPRQRIRQQIYHRALATVPGVKVILGKLTRSEEFRPLAKCAGSGKVRVVETKEKWSDVNLTSHLLQDGYTDAYRAAVLISGDSDFHLPVRIVREQLGKPIGVISPSIVPSRMLMKEATFYKVIHHSTLLACQFPNTMHDQHGEFHRPPEWTVTS
jgi:uncharacterized LabA/DUF88 family protein